MISESATEFDRLREAYIAMSKRAKYRPAAPIDGCGNITLSDEVLADPQQLGKEAAHYATEFINEGYRFWIGVSDFSTNRALVYTIESARNLCGGLGEHRHRDPAAGNGASRSQTSQTRLRR